MLFSRAATALLLCGRRATAARSERAVVQRGYLCVRTESEEGHGRRRRKGGRGREFVCERQNGSGLWDPPCRTVALAGGREWVLAVKVAMSRVT